MVLVMSPLYFRNFERIRFPFGVELAQIGNAAILVQ